jgi:hypothetical protein
MELCLSKLSSASPEFVAKYLPQLHVYSSDLAVSMAKYSEVHARFLKAAMFFVGGKEGDDGRLHFKGDPDADFVQHLFGLVSKFVERFKILEDAAAKAKAAEEKAVVPTSKMASGRPGTAPAAGTAIASGAGRPVGGVGVLPRRVQQKQTEPDMSDLLSVVAEGVRPIRRRAAGPYRATGSGNPREGGLMDGVLSDMRAGRTPPARMSSRE